MLRLRLLISALFLPPKLSLAALFTLLVLVGGCASSDTNEAIGSKEWSPSRSTATERPKSTVTPSPAGREFAFPADVKLEFEKPSTGDETQEAVLAAWTNFEKSIVKAALSEGWTDRTYENYSAPLVRLAISEYLDQKRETNSSVIGTRRFYDIRAQVGDDVATIVACRDDRNFYGRDLTSGRPLLTKPSANSFSELRVALAKSAQGNWLLESYVPKDRAKDCIR